MATNRLPTLITLNRRMTALQAGTAKHIDSKATFLVAGEALPVPKIIAARKSKLACAAKRRVSRGMKGARRDEESNSHVARLPAWCREVPSRSGA